MVSELLPTSCTCFWCPFHKSGFLTFERKAEISQLSRLRLYLFLVLLKSQTLLQTRYGITDFVLCNAVRQSDLKLAPTAGH